MNVKKPKKTHNEILEELSKHRNKWSPNLIRTKLVIRGQINARIKELKNPRNIGDKTGDASVRQAVLKKTGGKCFYCRRIFTTNKNLALRVPRLYFSQLEIDHIVPHSKRGPNEIGNYVPACHRCNNLKSDLSLSTFYSLLRDDMRRRGY